MEEIKITLETLYDILRNEKKKEDLQKLDDSFFVDVVSYLREKRRYLDLKSDDNDLFAGSEKDKLEYELRSIKRILKEIYEKREKKILDITLNRSRTGSDIIDTSSMLREEKDFYQKLLAVLDLYRKGILGSLFNEQLPEIVDKIKRVNLEIKPNIKKTEAFTKYEGVPPIVAEDDKDDEFSKESFEDDSELKAINEENETLKEDSLEDLDDSEKEKIKIKMLIAMPSFVWKDLNTYGPYEKGQEIEMFKEVADLMIRKGRAEEV